MNSKIKFQINFAGRFRNISDAFWIDKNQLAIVGSGFFFDEYDKLEIFDFEKKEFTKSFYRDDYLVEEDECRVMKKRWFFTSKGLCFLGNRSLLTFTSLEPKKFHQILFQGLDNIQNHKNFQKDKWNRKTKVLSLHEVRPSVFLVVCNDTSAINCGRYFTTAQLEGEFLKFSSDINEILDFQPCPSLALSETRSMFSTKSVFVRDNKVFLFMTVQPRKTGGRSLEVGNGLVCLDLASKKVENIILTQVCGSSYTGSIDGKQHLMLKNIKKKEIYPFDLSTQSFRETVKISKSALDYLEYESSHILYEDSKTVILTEVGMNLY